VAFGTYVVIGAPSVEEGIGQIMKTIWLVNLGFFVFNMIPIPPLDGSRVLYALAPEFVRRGMEAIERFGVMFIFLIILVASPVIGTVMRTATGFFIDIFSRIFGIY
jgi:Zn-dependent protease